jgi:hypothetical protein
MKITLCFKTPDVLDVVEEQIRSEYAEDFEHDGQKDFESELKKELFEEEIQKRISKIKKNLKQWISHSECISVEYDTENDTMNVYKRPSR